MEHICHSYVQFHGFSLLDLVFLCFVLASFVFLVPTSHLLPKTLIILHTSFLFYQFVQFSICRSLRVMS